MTAPRCAVCGDTGERITETPTSIGLYRETVPCGCAAGLALEAFLTAQLEAHWAAHPLIAGAGGAPAINRVVALDNPPAFPRAAPCGGDPL